MSKQKITTFLWFDNNAEEAISFYVSVFKNSRVVSLNRLPAEKPGELGRVITAVFELEGQQFMAVNGGPHFTFTEAISLFVSCESQAEVDALWNTLIADGGSESQCGWLKDKYGLSWQIIPSALFGLVFDKDVEKSKRAMDAVRGMRKIDIEKIRRAHAGLQGD